MTCPQRLTRRTLIATGLAAAPAMARALPAPRWDAIVSTSGRPGTFATLSAAIDAVRSLGRQSRIWVERGVYVEKPRLDVADVQIEGAGPESVITYGAAAGLRDPEGRKWGTGGSATLTVTAPGVTLARLTIRNSFDYLDDQRTGASGGAQAVALSLARGADRAIVRDCVIEGYQDTLYVQEGVRALIDRCLISGNVDFIFGGASARFERCEIRSRHVPGAEIQGFVAAPSTPLIVPVGLVFDRCRLTGEAGLPANSVFLGRPWRAGGNMALTGAATFLDCWVGAHIRRDGWTSMGFTDPQGVRRQLTPQEARLFELGSRGPGAGPAAPTRRLLDRRDRTRYQRAAMFGDWRPA